jgi:hypothetical protein
MHVATLKRLPIEEHLRCLDCGAWIWQFSTDDGRRVMLEQKPGPYLIDGYKAVETRGSNGYRDHWQHCRAREGAVVAPSVVADDFLWI